MTDECVDEDRVQDQGLATDDVIEELAAVPGRVQDRVDAITAPNPIHVIDAVVIDQGQMINHLVGVPGQDQGLHASLGQSHDLKIELMMLWLTTKLSTPTEMVSTPMSMAPVSDHAPAPKTPMVTYLL